MKQTAWKTNYHNLYKKEKNANSPICIKDIEFETEIFPTKKTSDPSVFTEEFYWTVKKEITSFLHKLFQKTKAEELGNKNKILL